MASRDSESSEDEGGDYTSTNVLLGYAAEGPTDDSFSRLGGFPTWLNSNFSPSAAFGKCKSCNGMMALLLQLNGDLPERFQGHERRLYIFGCRRKPCRRKAGSVRAIRGIRASTIKREPAKSISDGASSDSKIDPTRERSNLGHSIFGTNPLVGAVNGLNPFSTSTNSKNNPFSLSSSSNPFSPTILQPESAQPPLSSKLKDLPTTFAEKASISTPNPPKIPKTVPESWPPEKDLPIPYPSCYLDADYETLEAPSQPIAKSAGMDLDDSCNNAAYGKEDAETFESAIDKTFQRFADRLAQNPLQVLRYEIGGTPLLYSKSDAIGKLLAAHQALSQNGYSKITVASTGGAIGMPPCENCGARRVFEMQMTPQAIAELETEEVELDGMDWGTIIVGVCSDDCLPDGHSEGKVGYLEEWVGVQWEETGGLKR